MGCGRSSFQAELRLIAADFIRSRNVYICQARLKGSGSFALFSVLNPHRNAAVL